MKKILTLLPLVLVVCAGGFAADSGLKGILLSDPVGGRDRLAFQDGASVKLADCLRAGGAECQADLEHAKTASRGGFEDGLKKHVGYALDLGGRQLEQMRADRARLLTILQQAAIAGTPESKIQPSELKEIETKEKTLGGKITTAQAQLVEISAILAAVQGQSLTTYYKSSAEYDAVDHAFASALEYDKDHAKVLVCEVHCGCKETIYCNGERQESEWPYLMRHYRNLYRSDECDRDYYDVFADKLRFKNVLASTETDAQNQMRRLCSGTFTSGGGCGGLGASCGTYECQDENDERTPGTVTCQPRVF